MGGLESSRVESLPVCRRWIGGDEFTMKRYCPVCRWGVLERVSAEPLIARPRVPRMLWHRGHGMAIHPAVSCHVLRCDGTTQLRPDCVSVSACRVIPHVSGSGVAVIALTTIRTVAQWLSANVSHRAGY